MRRRGPAAREAAGEAPRNRRPGRRVLPSAAVPERLLKAFRRREGAAPPGREDTCRVPPEAAQRPLEVAREAPRAPGRLEPGAQRTAGFLPLVALRPAAWARAEVEWP